METSVSPAAAPNGKTLTYADGNPHDRVQFFDAKLILKPDFFATVRGFKSFSDLVAEAATKVKGVTYTPPTSARRARVSGKSCSSTPPTSGSITTPLFLRRRTEYQDGFPVSDPEIVFKFRHTDMNKAASVDVRPNIAGPYRVKFKSEALPLKDQPGGFRLLFSHNCIFPMSSVHDRRSHQPANDRQSVCPPSPVSSVRPRDGSSSSTRRWSRKCSWIWVRSISAKA